MESLIAEVKRCAPSKLLVYCGDECREVAVPNTRNRYHRVEQVVGAFAWTRVELLDKTGAVVGVVENSDRPASALAHVPNAEASRDEMLLNLLIRAQQSALANREAETKEALRASTEIVRVLTDSFKQLAILHREQLIAAVDAAESRAEAESSSEMSQLLEAAPLLLQALPGIRSMFSGTSSPVKLDGATE